MCHLHISHNVGHLPPKILHNLCFSFPVGIAAVPREIETMAHSGTVAPAPSRLWVRLFP